MMDQDEYLAAQQETALVLYSGPKEPEEEEKLPQQAWEDDSYGHRRQKYSGLINQGSTCYLNSMIQTLYMTPEFRKALYSWRYEQDFHGDKKDSIPYQLQRLFAQLQLAPSNSVSTRALTKSFQWPDSESFVQNDVHEFCRVLFDAIEQSFAITGEDPAKINTIYAGLFKDYVKCPDCGYMSEKTQPFLDISLPVKSQLTGVKNTSVEMAIENYLKPEILSEENKYKCSECGKEVCAEKGIDFAKIPPILNVSLSRFMLDLTSWDLKRIKIQDRLSFPFVLNMNNYIHGYGGIKHKCAEEEEKRQQKEYILKEKIRKEEELRKQRELVARLEAERIEKKRQDENHNMMAEDKPQYQLPQEKGENLSAIPDINGSSDLNSAIPQINDKSGSGVLAPPPLPPAAFHVAENGAAVKKERPIIIGKPQPEPEQLITQDDKYYTELMTSTKGPKKQILLGAVEEEEEDEKGTEMQTYSIKGQEVTMNDDSYAVKHRGERFMLGSKEGMNKLGSAMKTTQREEEEKEEEKRKQEEEQKQKAENEANFYKDEEEEIARAFSEGPLVYKLYSVMVHSGQAYGGHYYAYIRSFEDNKWYKFDDSYVSRSDPYEVMKAYGGKQEAEGYFSKEKILYNSSSNAYMLVYRLITTHPAKQDLKMEKQKSLMHDVGFTEVTNIKEEEVPEYLKGDLVEEIERIKKEEAERYQNLQKLLLKVCLGRKGRAVVEEEKEESKDPKPMDYQCKIFYTRKNKTILEVKLELMEFFKIPQDQSDNCRLRFYNPGFKVGQESLEGKEQMTMYAANIYTNKALMLEIKEEEEQFEQYHPDTLILKVFKWKKGIVSIAKSSLESDIISIRKSETIQQFCQKIMQEVYIAKEFEEFFNEQGQPIPDDCSQYLRIFKKSFEYQGVPKLEEYTKYPKKSMKESNAMEGYQIYCEISPINVIRYYKAHPPTSPHGLPVEPEIEDGVEIASEMPASLWIKEFLEEAEKVGISFNNPMTNPEDVTGSFTEKIRMNKQDTIGDMRAKIAAHCGISVDELILRKSGKNYPELKEDYHSLESEGFSNMTRLIFCEIGKRSKANEERLNFTVAKLNPYLHVDNQNFLYEDPQLQTVVPVDVPVKQVCEILAPLLSSARKEDINPEKIRLRDRCSNRLGKVLKRGDTLRQISIMANKLLAVELLEEPDPEFKPRDIVSVVRYWDSEEWTLGERKELIFEGTKTLHDMGEVLLKHYPEFESLENIMVHKLNSTWAFHRRDLSNESVRKLIIPQFHPVDGNRNVVENSPLFLVQDGFTIIVRDKRKKEVPLTTEIIEQLNLRGSSDNHSNFVTGDRWAKYDNMGKKGAGSDGHALKITVKGAEKKGETKSETAIKSQEEVDAEIALQMQEELENEEPEGLQPIF